MKKRAMQDPSESATFDELYYQLVRHMGYTWSDVMSEKVPQSLYSFERLREEGEERRERRKDVESKMPSKP